jgi:dynein heavy chain
MKFISFYNKSHTFAMCLNKRLLYFQSLEKRLAEILRLAYNQCPTVEAQLRLLEVFEGVSGRELVQVQILNITKISCWKYF